METIQFECKKVSMKQDAKGVTFTVVIHPDDVPEILFRDFVGAVYQAVLVRLDQDSKPMDRDDQFAGDRSMRIAGMLCDNPKFWKYLFEKKQITTQDYETATQWLRMYLELESRTLLKTHPEARHKLDVLHKEFNTWNQTN